jgi:hypothetical protein
VSILDGTVGSNVRLSRLGGCILGSWGLLGRHGKCECALCVEEQCSGWGGGLAFVLGFFRCQFLFGPLQAGLFLGCSLASSLELQGLCL